LIDNVFQLIGRTSSLLTNWHRKRVLKSAYEMQNAYQWTLCREVCLWVRLNDGFVCYSQWTQCHDQSVVKVQWDARQRRSPTSNFWVKEFPHLRWIGDSHLNVPFPTSNFAL